VGSGQGNIVLQASTSSQFTVDVQLSEAARKKLIDSKETIIVAGYFTGHPTQGTEVRYLDIKSGDVVLGDVKQEIYPGETAIFNEVKSEPGRTISNRLGRSTHSHQRLLRTKIIEGQPAGLRGLRRELRLDPWTNNRYSLSIDRRTVPTIRHVVRRILGLP
jgi:hypothetical protein